LQAGQREFRRFIDKVCIVTGAGQGIGRATAIRLADEGAKVIVAEWSRESADETVALLRERGAVADAIIVDVSSLKSAEALMSKSVALHGRIDVLINVVGGTIWWQPYERYTEEQIEAELQRSLYTTLWCCKAVLPYMIAQKSGAIVNFGSSVTQGGLYRVPYAVSKGGIVALTTTLAAENGRHNIRVNGVSPGTTIITDRKITRLMLKPGEEAPAMDNTQALIEETRNMRHVPLGRTGRAEEQAAVAAFLASDDASFITGQMIACDGGLTT
jgi:NAD(P)-dependent dehydrogenase (short-subunit alcohol dehydrogenase family)